MRARNSPWRHRGQKAVAPPDIAHQWPQHSVQTLCAQPSVAAGRFAASKLSKQTGQSACDVSSSSLVLICASVPSSARALRAACLTMPCTNQRRESSATPRLACESMPAISRCRRCFVAGAASNSGTTSSQNERVARRASATTPEYFSYSSNLAAHAAPSDGSASRLFSASLRLRSSAAAAVAPSAVASVAASCTSSAPFTNIACSWRFSSCSS
mmetsp:Transcript_4055/g.7890  ORF Transcript_4055/g.7890 Transcript_4055/m.7890 type:complete len:214 (+) Transcript_4055:149-790(+)